MSRTAARTPRIRPWLLGAVVATVLAVVAVMAIVAWPKATAVAAPAGADVATLPVAQYDAVIPGLLDVDGRSPASAQVYRTAGDLPLYDAPGGTPVARLTANDFTGGPTPVVVVEEQDGWGLVLTPARGILPSQSTPDRPAAAQTAGWAPLAGLVLVASPDSHVVVSSPDQTVSIVAGDAVLVSFPAAVGSGETPSPAGVVGYLEERYVDPTQGTGDQPIQLTSAHSTVADEPYGGSAGGLIGIHYSDDRSGAISHGCIRLGEDGIAALNALPLGTLVVFE